ncbi:hypothetical protein E3U55_02435 [Filobacillus milosensis]|uniref:YviE n=1 Tax=Filobacillus milosensis TaxID=94137 RepID=A0A4Y8IVN9_9BACI|nr:DUF6470 family protein [Filobacillus milosensis]TFB24378.1 hypothetical protein E3U55_02435 [Filobacillus milosensis]
MDFPQIRIQSQPAKINIQLTKGQQTIQQPKAEQSIQQPKADLQIKTTPSKLTIDQNQAWKDMGFLSSVEAAEESAQRGYQDLLAGIARRTQEGDQLMRIENGGDPIASISKSNANPPMKEFNIGWIPSAGSVKINYQPSEVNIESRTNKPIIEVRPRKPMHDYQPGNVNISMQQYQDLQIDFENLKYKFLNFEKQI